MRFRIDLIVCVRIVPSIRLTLVLSCAGRYIALLRDQVEAVEPPTLLQVWVDRISSLVPARLRAQYPNEMNALFLEVRDQFDDHIHDMTVRSIMMYPDDAGKAGKAVVDSAGPQAQAPAELDGMPLAEGRAERRLNFLQVRTT